ncbi:rod-binding protein, partial [Burkholderia gladioli]
MAEHEKIPAQGGEMPPGERAASTGGRGIDTVLGAEPAGNAAQKRNITAALTDDEREKLIDLVDRLIRNPDAVTAKDCIIGNDVRTVQWIAEHTRALLTSPRAAVPGQGWKLVPEIPTVEMLDAALPGDDTFGRGFKTRIYQEMLDAAPAAPAAPVEDVAPNVVEAIAEQWDGCMYAAPGIDIDIGEAIRAAAKRLDAAPAAPVAEAEPMLKAPEGEDPMADGQNTVESGLKRLRAAYCKQQPAPIPDQMALVWRADVMRLALDYGRLATLVKKHIPDAHIAAPSAAQAVAADGDATDQGVAKAQSEFVSA